MTFAEEMARRGQVKHGDKGEPGYELLHPPRADRMYHSSPSRNRDSIRRRGLVLEYDAGEGSTWPGVYLSPQPSASEWEDVWEVDVSDLLVQPDDADNMYEFRDVGGSYRVEQDIPPKRLNLVRRAKGRVKHGDKGEPGYELLHPSSPGRITPEEARRRLQRLLAWEVPDSPPTDPTEMPLRREGLYEVLTEEPSWPSEPGYQARLRRAFQQMYEMEYEAPDGSKFTSHLDEAYADPQGQWAADGRRFFAGGHVEDAEGKLIGEWAREIDFSVTGDVPHVNHIDFILNKEHRGKGFGEAFLAHTEREYAKAGIEEIRLTTGYATGGYAWARLGFDWDGMPDRVVSALANHWAYGDGSTDADRMLQSQAGGFVDRFDSPEEDDWPTPNDVAMLGHDGEHSGPGHGPDEMWLGKRLMLRSTWSGRKRVRSLVGVKSMPNRSQILARIEAQRHAELEAILAKHGHLGSEGLDWVEDDEPTTTDAKLARQQQWLETKAPEAEAAEALRALERDEASLRQDIAIFVRRQRREVLETIRAGRPRFDRSRWDRELALTVETKLRSIIERAGLDPDSGPARSILLRWVVSALALNASTAVALEVAVARAQLTEPPPPEPTGPSPTAVAATVAAALLLMRGESPSGDGWAPDVEWLHHLVGLVEGETGYQEWVAVNVVFAEAVIALRRKLDSLGMGTVGGETSPWRFAQGGDDGGFLDDDDGEGLMGPAELRRAADAANEVFDRAEMEVGPRVALSLVSGARHQAELEKVRAAGVATSKSWYSSRDERVRRWHRDAHGQTVPLGDHFRVGPDLMMFPHDPTASLSNRVNCRCVMVYKTEFSVPFTQAERSPWKAARSESMGTMAVDVLERQATWLEEWEAKHGSPGDPGYQLLHPRSKVPDRPGVPTGALARDIAKREARSERSRRGAATRAANRGKAPKAEAPAALPSSEMAPEAPKTGKLPRSTTRMEPRYRNGKWADELVRRWAEEDDDRFEPDLANKGYSLTAAQRKKTGPAPEGTVWAKDPFGDWDLQADVAPEAEKIGSGESKVTTKVSDSEVADFVEALSGVTYPQGIEGRQTFARVSEEHPELTGAVLSWVRGNIGVAEISGVVGYRGQTDRNPKMVAKGTKGPHIEALARAISSSRSSEMLYRAYSLPIGSPSPTEAFKVGENVSLPATSATRSEALTLNWWGGDTAKERKVIYRIPPGTHALNIEAINPSQFEHIVSGKFKVGAVEVIDGFTYVDLVHTGDFL